MLNHTYDNGESFTTTHHSQTRAGRRQGDRGGRCHQRLFLAYLQDHDYMRNVQRLGGGRDALLHDVPLEYVLGVCWTPPSAEAIPWPYGDALFGH